MAEQKPVTSTSVRFTNAGLTNYALDRFIAPQLSKLDLCGAGPLAEYPNYGAALRGNKIIHGHLTDAMFLLVQNFVNRLDAAASEYREARTELTGYIDTISQRNVGQYYKSVARFENCIFHLYLAIRCIKRLSDAIGGSAIFEANDGSPYDRLRLLFNRTKHFDEDIDATDLASTVQPLMPLWISNSGLECSRGTLLFTELQQIFSDAFDDAKYFSSELAQEIIERRKEARSEDSNN